MFICLKMKLQRKDTFIYICCILIRIAKRNKINMIYIYQSKDYACPKTSLNCLPTRKKICQTECSRAKQNQYVDVSVSQALKGSKFSILSLFYCYTQISTGLDDSYSHCSKGIFIVT